MIDHNTIQKILDTAEIVDVVSDFVSLKRRGANYIACCPFHSEKTPSFSVSPSKGIFKCFGCGKAGSAVTFVMEHEHLTYAEAIKYLGNKYGIEVVEKQENEEQTKERLRFESLLVVSEFAKDFFVEILHHTQAGKSIGLSYFKEARGFSDEIIQKFGLGFAPDPKKMVGTPSLAEAATKAGYKKEFLLGTGLCIERNDGSLIDKFYDRVMFPIHSLSGRVIAFGGRTLLADKSVAKYINSPETEIYHKSDTLYGIFQAKNAIAKKDKCYLVEGYTDVISFHQAGIENVVASSGTSLTQGQIRLIKRFTNRITVLYDGDPAGIKASIRGIDMLIEEGLEVKVALFPDGHDPDSFARSHSTDEILLFLERGETDFIDFKYELLSKEISKDPLRKAELIKEIVRTIALIPDRIVRTVYIERSSSKLGIKQEILSLEVGKIRRDNIITGEFNRQRAEERQKRIQEITPPPPSKEEEQISTPFLAPYEKEILYYLIKFGKSTIHFEEEGLVNNTTPIADILVEEYIHEELRNDDLELVNPLYKTIFDSYYHYSLEESSNDSIIRRFANGEDELITKTVLSIVYPEYVITSHTFKESLPPEEQQISIYIPKSILVYKAKITEHKYNTTVNQLGEAEKGGDVARQEALLKELRILMMVKNQFAKELNRLT